MEYYLGSLTGRLGHHTIGSRPRCNRSTCEELELGRANTVRQTDCGCEVDQITGGNVKLINKRAEDVHGIRQPSICVAILRELDGRVVDERPIRASPTERRREADTIMESHAERFADVLPTFVVEHVRLQMIAEREESAACFVRCRAAI